MLGKMISALILLGIIALIVWLNVDKKRKDKTCAMQGQEGGCGGGCADCPMRGSCH